jgi:ribosomal protein S18 acetylase RimI-like enzyme
VDGHGRSAAPAPGEASLTVRRLVPPDAQAFHSLRLRGLLEFPAAFAASPAEEAPTPVSDIARRLEYRPDGALFGAFSADALVAIAGVQREAMTKLAHKAFLWGVYSAPEARRQGHGRQVVAHALRYASDELGVLQVNLGVNVEQRAALALYRSLGFETFGTERGFLRVDGVLHDEHHMVWRARPVSS